MMMVDYIQKYILKKVFPFKEWIFDLKNPKKKMIVIIISTVLPGTIRKKILPVTNKYTQIGYNPFFIAMGTTIDDFLYPEIILFGSENKFVSQKAQSFYRTLTNSPFFETTIENAELIKVVYNTFISTKIAYIIDPYNLDLLFIFTALL